MRDRVGREALRARLSALTDTQRGALAEALQADSGPGSACRLVAYVGPASGAPSADELDAFLRQRLPEHMIPARYVALERLPRTASGKLDRRGVRETSGTELTAATAGFVAPRTPEEVALAEIWRAVLGVDEVGVHDDFFEIGGDSLLSIRVIARAGRAGLAITPEDFFDHPTIARLAVDRASPAVPEEGEVTGRAPLTPIQSWFFERFSDTRDHWNQAFLFDLRSGLEADALGRAIDALVAHHDALRLRFVIGDEGWEQEIPAAPERSPFRVVDLSDAAPESRAARIEAEADREHTSLDVQAGGLFRAVLFEGSGGFRRLLLLAHHLILDMASWGILLEDLTALLGAEPAARDRFPPKTSSALTWSRALAAAAERPEILAAADHWLESPGGAPTPDGRAEERGVAAVTSTDAGSDPEGSSGQAAAPDRMGDARRVALTLGEAETKAVLSDAPRRPSVGSEEILLAAFALGWSRWKGRGVIQIDVESHGRDALPAVDVSRTVGWFTTFVPLTLDLSAGDARAAVEVVRTALASLPQGRGTWGLLRYLHPDADTRMRLARLHRSEVLFNFLGSVDDLLRPDAGLARAVEPTGRARSDSAPRAHPIEVNARVEDARLTLSIEYPGGQHAPGRIDALVEAVRTAVSEVLESPSRSAFELAGLGDVDLARVAELLTEADGGAGGP